MKKYNVCKIKNNDNIIFFRTDNESPELTYFVILELTQEWKELFNSLYEQYKLLYKINMLQMKLYLFSNLNFHVFRDEEGITEKVLGDYKNYTFIRGFTPIEKEELEYITLNFDRNGGVYFSASISLTDTVVKTKIIPLRELL